MFHANRLIGCLLWALLAMPLFFTVVENAQGTENEAELSAPESFRGKLVIINRVNRTVNLFSEQGQFLRELLHFPPSSGFSPLSISQTAEQILVTATHSSGQIMLYGIPFAGELRNAQALYSNPQLSGAISQVFALSPRHLLLTDSDEVQHVWTNGAQFNRLVGASFPSFMRGVSGFARYGVNLLACSAGQRAVHVLGRNFEKLGGIDPNAAGIPTAITAQDCEARGNLAAVIWGPNYATNAISARIELYNSPLLTAAPVCRLENPGMLTLPRALAFRNDGKILIADEALHHIVVMRADCVVENIIYSAAIAGPMALHVIQ